MGSRATEKEVQAGVLRILDILQAAGLLAFRRVNNGARMYGGRRVKSFGSRGIPDIVVMAHGRVGWMELKRPKGGRLSEDQVRFRDDCLSQNIPWAQVKSVVELMEFLRKEMGTDGPVARMAFEAEPSVYRCGDRPVDSP